MRLLEISRLSVVQGSCETRSESYIKYGERALEQMMRQYAKSTSRVFGSAKKQDGAARCF